MLECKLAYYVFIKKDSNARNGQKGEFLWHEADTIQKHKASKQNRNPRRQLKKKKKLDKSLRT